MRSIILGLAVSLDGYIEGPNGEYDWCFTDQDYGMKDFFKRVDTIFMGRKSYELAKSMGDAPAGFPKLKTYVFSNTLQNVEKDEVLIGHNWKEKVQQIKNEPGKDIWLFGGASLVSSFLNEKLIDEFWLAVHPVILGGGKPLFSNVANKVSLKLIESKTYNTGLISLKYIPA
ncbi:MAG: dihydrofolate reductase [Sphingobacteriales bacterium]|nr:dihydrofolate reductase [Sphingobacteriales bacterium]